MISGFALPTSAGLFFAANVLVPFYLFLAAVSETMAPNRRVVRLRGRSCRAAVRAQAAILAQESTKFA